MRIILSVILLSLVGVTYAANDIDAKVEAAFPSFQKNRDLLAELRKAIGHMKGTYEACKSLATLYEERDELNQ